MAERPPGDELGGLAGRSRDALERELGRLPGTICPPELCGGERLQREVVGDGDLLTGLLAGLAALLGTRRGALELAELALDLPEQDKDVRQRAFVAQLPRSLEHDAEDVP